MGSMNLNDPRDDAISMKCMKRRYALAPSLWDSLIGIRFRDITNQRDEPRPAVAPFSSDQNGMIDEDENLQVGYPPETLEDEDDVMMDFVAGR
jgi:hypothetical protein